MLIGLYGPSRAGKDSVAQILVDDFGYEQRAQAAAIRKILLGLNPVILDNNGEFHYMQDLFRICNEDWDAVKAISKESVDYMIRLGQTCRDILGLNIWLNTAIPPICSLCNGSQKLSSSGVQGINVSECPCRKVNKKIVISDVRQPNEYDAIKERGGKIWKIVRPGVEKRGMDGILDDRDFDATLYNSGSLFDLRGMVQATISSMYEIDRIKGKGYGATPYGR